MGLSVAPVTAAEPTADVHARLEALLRQGADAAKANTSTGGSTSGTGGTGGAGQLGGQGGLPGKGGIGFGGAGGVKSGCVGGGGGNGGNGGNGGGGRGGHSVGAIISMGGYLEEIAPVDLFFGVEGAGGKGGNPNIPGTEGKIGWKSPKLILLP